MPEFEVGTFTAGTLLGIILGAFLGHALAIRRGKFQVKYNAAIEFRKSMMPAVLEIDRGKNVAEVITGAFQNHYEAAVEYSAYLRGNNLLRFKSVLEDYKTWHKIMCNRSRSEIMYGQDDPKYIDMLKTEPIKYMNQLLEYANT